MGLLDWKNKATVDGVSWALPTRGSLATGPVFFLPVDNSAGESAASQGPAAISTVRTCSVAKSRDGPWESQQHRQGHTRKEQRTRQQERAVS